MQTAAHILQPTDVYCQFLCCSIPKYPSCTGAGLPKHTTNAAAALSSCSPLQVFDRETELPGWTGQVSEVMQPLLTSQNLKPAVHTHPCTTFLPELSIPTAPSYTNHDPEGHLCHLEHHPGESQLYELQLEIKQLFLLILAFSLCNLLCPILLCMSLTNPPGKDLFAHIKTTPSFHLHVSL